MLRLEECARKITDSRNSLVQTELSGRGISPVMAVCSTSDEPLTRIQTDEE